MIAKPKPKIKICKCGGKRKLGSSLCYKCFKEKAKLKKEATLLRKKERKLNSVGYYNKQVKKLEKECDNAWSLKVRAKCKCELCGRGGDIKGFDAHHLVPRAKKITRWNLDNGVCLCGKEGSGCHRYKVHQDTFTAGILIQKLIEKRGLGWIENLDCLRYQVFKPTLNWLKNKLKELNYY